MPGALPSRMSVREFLAWEGEPGVSYELVGGAPVAMAPPTIAHGILVSNLARLLDARIEAPCYVASEAALEVPGRDDSYYQVDLLVSCTPMQAGDRTAREPTLLVEVLSRSTASHDRGTKLPDYRELSSVDEILFVSSYERRVETWRRDGERWVVETAIADGACAVLGGQLGLEEIYSGVAPDAAG